MSQVLKGGIEIDKGTYGGIFSGIKGLFNLGMKAAAAAHPGGFASRFLSNSFGDASKTDAGGKTPKADATVTTTPPPARRVGLKARKP